MLHPRIERPNRVGVNATHGSLSAVIIEAQTCGFMLFRLPHRKLHVVFSRTEQTSFFRRCSYVTNARPLLTLNGSHTASKKPGEISPKEHGIGIAHASVSTPHTDISWVTKNFFTSRESNSLSDGFGRNAAPFERGVKCCGLCLKSVWDFYGFWMSRGRSVFYKKVLR